MSDKHEREEENQERYIRDIATIKDILVKSEQKPIYEHWAFYLWGILVILGSVIHFIVQKRFEPTARQLFLEIWLPVLLIAGFVELLTFIRSMSRQALNLFTRTVRRFYLSLLGGGVAFCLLVIMLNRDGVTGTMPIAFLLGAAIFYFFLAQITYTHVYIHGYLFLVFAILLYIFDLSHEVLVPIVGVLVGVSLVAVGVTIRVREKSKHA